MIFAVARLWSVRTWHDDQDTCLTQMRQAIWRKANDIPNTEVIEIIYVTRDNDGLYRTAKAENATHVKVTLEMA